MRVSHVLGREACVAGADEDDTAYLVRSVENSFLGITRLAPNYLGLEGGICSVTSFQVGSWWCPAAMQHVPSMTACQRWQNQHAGSCAVLSARGSQCNVERPIWLA